MVEELKSGGLRALPQAFTRQVQTTPKQFLIERLADDVVNAGIFRSGLIFSSIAGARAKQELGAFAGAGSDEPAELQAIRARHAPIADHNVRGLRTVGTPSLLSVRTHHDLMMQGFEY